MCLWTPCGSSRTFKRPTELQRHYTDKHVRPIAYRCTALVHNKPCSKEYYRPDKLRYHIRTEHLLETEFVCPIPPCNAGPYTFDLLCVHVDSHDSTTKRNFLGLAQSCYNIGQHTLFCPVKDCGAKEKSIYYEYHLLVSHDTDTRASNREAIRGAGYNLDGKTLCPICGDSIGENWLSSGAWLWAPWSHMFDRHWHEPEMLHKHRRDFLKICRGYGSTNFVTNKVFKDVLATVLAEK